MLLPQTPADPESAVGWASRWAETASQILAGLVSKLAEFLPNLLGALVILLVGWLIAALARKLTATLLGRIGFDALVEKIGLGRLLARTDKTGSYLVATLVFWFFVLTFLASASESLGLDNISATLTSFVAYLPNVLAALILVVVGTVLAGFVKNVVAVGAENMGLEFGAPLSNLAYAVVLIVIASLAASQLQVQTELVNGLVMIAFIATAGAIALALGLGTRDIAKQVIAGVYARDLYEPGVELCVGEDSGVLIEVGATTTILQREDGQRIFVPNDKLNEVVVRAGAPPDEESEDLDQPT